MELFFLGIIFILTGGFFSFFVKDKLKAKVLVFFSALSTLFLVKLALSVLLLGKVVSGSLFFPYPILEVNLTIDFLAAFFILIISLMSFLGLLYSVGYLKHYLNEKRTIGAHTFLLSLLIASMLLVVVIQNALAFLFVWELMSLSSFFLVVFENEKREVFNAGIKYLVAMHISLLFLLLGFALLSVKSYSFDFQIFKYSLEYDKSIAGLIFMLFFIGFGIKAGFIPFHTWLPSAHPAAPSHISGIMSGVMIKTGIYGILRVISFMPQLSLGFSYFVLAISLVSAGLGVIYAIAQHDFKKLLAYHSVENIGIIGIGIGVGMLGVGYGNSVVAILGFSGALLHVLNHAIFKELLFYGAGAVYNSTHTRQIDRLGGLAKKMPYTALFFLIGSLAISGLPPLNGFISEFMIYMALVSGLKIINPLFVVTMIMSIAMLSLVGIMAILCFTKIFSTIFLGTPRVEFNHKIAEADNFMLISMAVLAFFSITIGLFPQYAFTLVENVSLSLVGIEKNYGYLNILNTLVIISSFGFLLIGFSFLIYFVKQAILKNKPTSEYKTWDCGYQMTNSRMQYTASSYADTFINLVNVCFKKEIHLKPPKNIFPDGASFESHYKDIFEVYIFNPVGSSFKKVFDFFAWIQSGSIQHYILYGIIFLVGALGWIIIVK